MLGIENFERVVTLAKLDFDEKEFPAFEAEINEIINLVQELQEVDTQGVEPTYFGNDLRNVYREDRAHSENKQQAFLKNSPSSQDGFIQVPAIIESEGE